jgi:sigma-70-like protein
MRAQLDEEFRDFMHGRWPAMVRLAYALTGDQGHAEDVAQTAFARAYASWPKVRRTGNPEAYVRRIVINENLNRFRKHRVAERLTGTLPDSVAGALSGPLAGSLAAAGAGSPAGLIASGTINGKYWQLATGKPGTGGTTSGNQEIYLSGAALENAMTGIVPDLSTDHPAPVAFEDVGIPPVEAQYGPVRADVSYVKVTLDNGTVLTLHPVTAYGARVVAFATPVNATIVSATAYSRHGEIATAIPFNEGDGQAFFGIWLKPGQHGIGRASGSIGSGTIGGNTWSASAYLGPWGVCIVSVTGSICAPAAASTLGTAVMASTESGTPRVITGVAAPSVVRIVVHQPDGTVTQVRPVTIGGQKFFAFSETNGAQGLNWTAYDSSGSVVTASPG